jgi:hypothetical protein
MSKLFTPCEQINVPPNARSYRVDGQRRWRPRNFDKMAGVTDPKTGVVSGGHWTAREIREGEAYDQPNRKHKLPRWWWGKGGAPHKGKTGTKLGGLPGPKRDYIENIERSISRVKVAWWEQPCFPTDDKNLKISDLEHLKYLHLHKPDFGTPEYGIPELVSEFITKGVMKGRTIKRTVYKGGWRGDLNDTIEKLRTNEFLPDGIAEDLFSGDSPTIRGTTPEWRAQREALERDTYEDADRDGAGERPDNDEMFG